MAYRQYHTTQEVIGQMNRGRELVGDEGDEVTIGVDNPTEPTRLPLGATACLSPKISERRKFSLNLKPLQNQLTHRTEACYPSPSSWGVELERL